MSNDNGGLKPFLCSTIDPNLLRSEWERWKRAFTIYAGSNEIVDQTKLKHKLLHLGGLELQDVFFGIPDADVPNNEEGTEKVFDIAIKKLDEHFAPKRNSVFERHVFRNMKIDAGESFERFLIRLRKQADKCSFGENAVESKEINLKDKIIEFSTNELKAKLLEKEMSLDEMVSLCNVYGQIKSQTEQMNKSSISNASSMVQHVSKNSPTSRKMDKKNIRCFICNTLGHFAAECKQRYKVSASKSSFGSTFQSRSLQKCNTCGLTGHLDVNCRNKRKHPWKETNKDNYAKRQKFSNIQQITESDVEILFSILVTTRSSLIVRLQEEMFIC